MVKITYSRDDLKKLGVPLDSYNYRTRSSYDPSWRLTPEGSQLFDKFREQEGGNAFRASMKFNEVLDSWKYWEVPQYHHSVDRDLPSTGRSVVSDKDFFTKSTVPVRTNTVISTPKTINGKPNTEGTQLVYTYSKGQPTVKATITPSETGNTVKIALSSANKSLGVREQEVSLSKGLTKSNIAQAVSQSITQPIAQGKMSYKDFGLTEKEKEVEVKTGETISLAEQIKRESEQAAAYVRGEGPPVDVVYGKSFTKRTLQDALVSGVQPSKATGPLASYTFEKVDVETVPASQFQVSPLAVSKEQLEREVMLAEMDPLLRQAYLTGEQLFQTVWTPIEAGKEWAGGVAAGVEAGFGKLLSEGITFDVEPSYAPSLTSSGGAPVDFFYEKKQGPSKKITIKPPEFVLPKELEGPVSSVDTFLKQNAKTGEYLQDLWGDISGEIGVQLGTIGKSPVLSTMPITGQLAGGYYQTFVKDEQKTQKDIDKIFSYFPQLTQSEEKKARITGYAGGQIIPYFTPAAPIKAGIDITASYGEPEFGQEAVFGVALGGGLKFLGTTSRGAALGINKLFKGELVLESEKTVKTLLGTTKTTDAYFKMTSPVARTYQKLAEGVGKYGIPTYFGVEVGMAAAPLGGMIKRGETEEAKEYSKELAESFGAIELGSGIGTWVGSRVERPILNRIVREELIATYPTKITVSDKHGTATIEPDLVAKVYDRVFFETKGKIPEKVSDYPIEKLELMQAYKGHPKEQAIKDAIHESLIELSNAGIYSFGSGTGYGALKIEPPPIGDIDMVAAGLNATPKKGIDIIQKVWKKHGVDDLLEITKGKIEGEFESGVKTPSGESIHAYSLHGPDMLRENIAQSADMLEFLPTVFSKTESGYFQFNPRVQWKMNIAGGYGPKRRSKDIRRIQEDVLKGSEYLVKEPTNLRKSLTDFWGDVKGEFYGNIKQPETVFDVYAGSTKAFKFEKKYLGAAQGKQMYKAVDNYFKGSVPKTGETYGYGKKEPYSFDIYSHSPLPKPDDYYSKKQKIMDPFEDIYDVPPPAPKIKTTTTTYKITKQPDPFTDIYKVPPPPPTITKAPDPFTDIYKVPPPPPTITTTPPPPPPPPPRGFPFEMPKEKKKPQKGTGFDVYAKSKGKWLKINPEPYLKDQALGFGGHVIDTHAEASFRIQKTGEKVKRRTDIPVFQPEKFRLSKDKKYYVEKNKNRIDSYGELMEIPVKGVKTIKQRKAAGLPISNKAINKIFKGVM